MLEKQRKQADLLQRMKQHTEEVDSTTKAEENMLVDELQHKHEAERKEDDEFFDNLEQQMMANSTN
jgi:hypothetical protein